MNEMKEWRVPRSDVAALLALAGLSLIFFWKIALTNRVLAGLDLLAYFYPYRDLIGAALRAGRLPLWNPYLFMGAPLLANSQAAVLYPLHWPLIGLDAPKQVAWSIVIHIWLAGAGSYLLAHKVLKLRPVAAFTAAAVFALGGFLGAQVEHVNQLNASAWLPWLLLCLEGAMHPGKQRRPALLGGGAVAGLMLLAGHTQAAYIVLFGAAIYALVRRANRQAALRGIAALSAMGLIGGLLAAGQLLPTLELSRLSVRSGGLPYNEAASFSLKPGLIFKAFLPPLLWEPPFSEYVAYIGLIGLALAAVGAWVVLRHRPPHGAVGQDGILPNGGAMLAPALAGLFLAFGAYNPVYYLLYRLVPGFALFRAPARWLLLYSFGAAMLAGIGLEAVQRHPTRRFAIAFLLIVELFVAGRRLAYNNPTAPAAFDSMRTAPAHLLAHQTHSGDLFRFVSMSDIRYDPGDLGDLQAMYRPTLPERAVYDLIVATKMKEVLAYNLPLSYRLFSVDGYDGGLLPIKNYVTLERLFLKEDEIWPDGRLRQQLRQVPPARLLSLLNVRYVITDKTQDIWVDGVFYDLEHTVPLGQVTLTDLPDFETSHLGLVSYLTGTAALPDGAAVAQVTICGTVGQDDILPYTVTLRAGEQTAEGLYQAGTVAHRLARVGHHWRDNEQGNDYIALLDLGQTVRPTVIAVRSLLPGRRFYLRGLTLMNRQSNTSRTLSVDPAYRLVHSGDVKIYENLDVLPRAFVVHQARVEPNAEEALRLLRDPAFDPARQVILAEGDELSAGGGWSAVEIVAYRPEQVLLNLSLDAPGYLVLTDAWYPGWVAEVDGQAVPILRADLYFRAVELAAGEHRVTFRYRPGSVRLGLGVSLASWLAWGVGVALTPIRFGHKGTSSV